MITKCADHDCAAYGVVANAQYHSTVATPCLNTNLNNTTRNQAFKRQKLLDEKAFAKTVVMDNMDIVTSNRGEIIASIEAAATAKNYVKQEQMMFELFMEDRNSGSYRLQ